MEYISKQIHTKEGIQMTLINFKDEFQMDLINMDIDQIILIEEIPYKRVIGGFNNLTKGRISLDELIFMTRKGAYYQILTKVKRVR